MSALARSDAPPPRRRRRRWPWLIGGLVLLGATGAFVIQKRARPEPIDPALVVTAAREPLVIEVVDIGRIEAWDEVAIESKVPGRVAKVLVEEGDRVEEGQLLVKLDPRDAARVVARENATLARARALFEHAERERERKQRGIRDGIVTGVELDGATHGALLSKLDVSAARVALATARDRLNDTEIRAPRAGTVIRRAIEPGEMVVPGIESTFEKRALLTIADLSRLLVRVELNQIDVAKVRPGQRVSLRLDALPGETFPATVREVAAASIRTPGKDADVFPIEAVLERADSRIKPGMTADVRIFVDEKSDVVSLPLEAVRREPNGAFVELVEVAEGRELTRRVEVVLGAANDRDVEIVSGVAAGDRVLVDPPSASDNETKI